MATATVILSGARTPIGKLSGVLGGRTAANLGAVAIAGALARGGLEPGQVDRVVMGQVLQAGAGQNPARQAAVGAGIPLGVPAMTVNKVCLSGLQAIHLGDLLIRAGEASVVVAGGMESMTAAPHLLGSGRAGMRLGGAELRDAILSDGLTCAFEDTAMGAMTDADARRAGIDRDRQDAVAAASHQRAAEAASSGRCSEEIVPVTVPQRRGDPIVVEADEGIVPGTTVASLGRLRPAFAGDGTITAGNASQISDGAAAVVLCEAATAERLGIEPLAEVVGYGEVAGPDASLLTQPSRALMAATERAGWRTDDLDVVEINEAFAAVVCASLDDLDRDLEAVNPNGGAIALGHPIGMSGTRLALTVAFELRRRGGGLGAATLCGGGGLGDAVLLRRR